MGRAAGTASRKKGRPLASSSASAAPLTAGSGGWAELPEGLLLLVLDRLPSVADLFAVAAVCCSWRALAGPGPPASAVIGGGRPPFLLSPVLVDGADRRWLHPRRCRLLSPADPATSYRCLVPSGTLTSPVIGYSHGHLVSCRGRRPLLADIVRGDVLRAPELPPDCRRREHGVLTAPLSAPDCNLLLLSRTRWRASSILLRWRVGEREWSEHRLGPGTEYMNRITVFRGRIFVLDLLGRLFTVEFSPHFSVRKLAVQWTAEGSCPSLNDLTELVECDGELMLVRFVYAQSLFDVKVDVSRLDLSGPPAWVRVESLGERALFVEVEHGTSAWCPNPSRWGGRSNCIYLAWRYSDAWTVLPLDGKVVDLYDPKDWLHRAKDPSMKWPAHIWVFPSMLY